MRKENKLKKSEAKYILTASGGVYLLLSMLNPVSSQYLDNSPPGQLAPSLWTISPQYLDD